MPFEFLNTLKKEFKNMDLDMDYDYEDSSNQVEEDKEKNSLSVDAMRELLNFHNSMRVLRDETKVNIISIFERAYIIAPYESIILLFYLRDKSRGLGERRVFNILLNYLGKSNCKIIKRNLNLIPKYGRYDDLYSLFYTPLEIDVIELIKEQLEIDFNSDMPSTLAKWLKSENTSSKESRELGKRTRALLKLTPKEYRRRLSYIRNKLGIVEHNISQKEYTKIEYGSIPKKALYKYNKAFEKYDNERYNEYLEFNTTINSDNNTNMKSKVMSNGVKINEVLFPYNLMEGLSKCSEDYSNDIYCNLWNSIPNYWNEEAGDIMVTIGYKDIDGVKLQDRDIYKGGIGTVLYIKDKNKGVYKNHIITMKDNVNFKRIKGDNIKERIKEVSESANYTDINIEASLDLILLAAIKNDISDKDIPKRLLFIMDENCKISTFNNLYKENLDLNEFSLIYDKLKAKWASSGFVLPSLTFWYIESKDLNKFETFNNETIQIITGYSNKIFLSLLQNDFTNVFDNIKSIINSPRYELIV